MARSLIIFTVSILLALVSFVSAGAGILDTPDPFISEPPFIPITDFSPHTYQLTVSGIYGYEDYDLPVLTSFPIHRGGIQAAASGAFTGTLGWNAALGVSFIATIPGRVSIEPGSCIIPLSASLGWRFAGGPDRSNCTLVGGFTYAYSLIRGYYQISFPGPPTMFYYMKVNALADVLGSVYGLFAGIKPQWSFTKNVSLRPFLVYRITFDTSAFYYHVRMTVVNDEPEKSGIYAFKQRRRQEADKPISELLLGLELYMYGVGVHVVGQFSLTQARSMVQLGLSYTHSFGAPKE